MVIVVEDSSFDASPVHLRGVPYNENELDDQMSPIESEYDGKTKDEDHQTTVVFQMKSDFTESFKIVSETRVKKVSNLTEGKLLPYNNF